MSTRLARGGRGQESEALYVHAAKVVAVAAVYFGSAKFGLTLAFANSSITAIWPPTGIALAAIVLGGYRLWPGVALGAFLANSWTGVPLVTVCGITAGNTLEALVGAYLLKRVGGFRPSLERIRDVVALVVLAALVSTTVSATIGVMSLRIGDAVAGSDLASAWRVWWLGDMGGDLLVAPFVLVFATSLRSLRLSHRPERVVEAGVLLALLVGVSALAFLNRAPIGYVIFPVLIWAALRFRQQGATAASLIVAAIAVWFTANDLGPFVQDSRDDSLLFSQTFVGVAAMTVLLLAAITTERERAEEGLAHAATELERRATELERSNADLQQFAYAASHDLSEPLRMVSSYVQLLGRRYQGKLDSDADDFIGFAVDGVARMQALIDGLLEFSRAGTSEYALGVVDCSKVVRETLATLNIDERKATVTVDPLPPVRGDASQLGQLFQNLISNAIKFTSDRPPRVHISAQRESDGWRFLVMDNGIGVDPGHAERIFNVFQRLHGHETYPGSGVGLAICKRIVERHGGRIWVEPGTEGGSTFCFTLPCA